MRVEELMMQRIYFRREIVSEIGKYIKSASGNICFVSHSKLDSLLSSRNAFGGFHGART